PAAQQELTRALDDPDPKVRRQAQTLLERLRPAEEVGLDRALRDLKSPEPKHRTAALGRLALLPVDAKRQAEVSRAVEASLDDPEEVVRYAAVQPLAAWATPESVPRLIKFLDSKSPDERRAALGALGRLKDERAIAPLVGRLGDASDRDAARKALE